MSVGSTTACDPCAPRRAILFYTRYGGLYNETWRLQSATVSRTIIQQTYFIYGVTNWMDVEIAPQWLQNSSEGQSFSGFGGLPLQLGLQVLRGDSDSWPPDVRIWVQEILPTGRCNDLPLSTIGVEGTGGGSFATTLYGFYSSVTVRGFNAYGGGFGTDGRVDPGAVATLTVA